MTEKEQKQRDWIERRKIEKFRKAKENIKVNKDDTKI
jgi:hypothetical protein